MAFFQLWNDLKEQQAALETSEQPRLKPAQLSRLHGEVDVREALKEEVASLLPPVGREVFRRFTADSLHNVEQQHGADEQKQHKTKEKQATVDHQSKPSTHLDDGEPLPFFFGDPPPELLSTPLEELDPFYQSEKTFLVLSRGNILHRFNAEPSCFLFSPSHYLRTGSIKIILNTWFQWFILLMLLINCVTMLFNDAMWKQIMECIFTAVYTLEVALKVSSKGFCFGRFTFIRDPWNWLDLLILSTAYPAHFVDFGKLSVLVTIPRVLKIFSASPSLRNKVEALIRSGKKFVHIFIITIFCLCVISVIATQCFMGNLHFKCVFLPAHMTSENFTYVHDDYFTTSAYDFSTNDTVFDFTSYIMDPVNHYRLPGNIDALTCGNISSGGDCPEGSRCLYAGNPPNYGYTSYDSFGWSLLSMFRLLTQDFWENLLQLTMRTTGTTTIMLFLLIFFPACFLILSLLLAVVVMVKVDQEKIKLSKRKWRAETLRRIEEVLQRKEQEKTSSKEETQAKQTNEEEEGVAVTVADGDHLPPPCWQKFRLWFRPLVLSPHFDLVIILCLIINIVIMATEHFPLSETHDIVLGNSFLVFTVIFAVEMVLRMLALGIKGYFQVSWHIFDAILVVLSLLELCLAGVQFSSFLRCQDLLRMFRLARWWPGLHLLLRIVWSSLQTRTLRVILVLVFLWVVVGMQLFQTDYNDNVCAISSDCSLPRWHMGDLVHIFFLVFRVLCWDWIETMWDCMEVSNPGTCVVYFITLVVFGKLLVLILFFELLLDSARNYKLEKLNEIADKRKQTWMGWCTKQWKHLEPAHKVSKDQKEFLSLTVVTEEKTQPSDAKKKAGEDNQKDTMPEDCCCNGCSPVQNIDSSQGSGRVWTNSRRVCLLIVENQFFKGFMVFVILLSSILLVFEDIYLLQHPVLLQLLDWADLVFTLIFLLEMVLKFMGFGFKKYFSSFSCWLDFLVLDVSLVALILQCLGISCRPLRALRTLRILSRFQGPKVVLRSLAVTLPYLVRVLLVVLLVWHFFGMLGVRLFGGKFNFCFNETSEEIFLTDNVENMSDCLDLTENSVEVRWKNSYFHFDSAGMSFLSLLLLTTSSAWPDILYSALDSAEIQSQPSYENSIHFFPYFICFTIASCFFCFHFFIRDLLRGIHDHRHQIGGKHLFISREQQIYSIGFKKRFNTKPSNPFPPPKNSIQARLFAMVTSQRFEIFMVSVICLNVIILGMDRDNLSYDIYVILEYFNLGFIFIFLLEFLLKIVALRCFYFSSTLNLIDLCVLITSCLDLFIGDLVARYYSLRIVVIFRLARLGRVLKFFCCTQGIRTLVLGFVMSLPALVNIGFLLLVLTFTFAVVGMFNFGYALESFAINDMVNFKTFWSSLVTMTMVSTTSSWDGLLMPLMATPPDCDPYKENPGSPIRGDCGNPAAAIIFFTSYILLFILLVVHLFIAVILEAFNAREPTRPNLEDPETLSDQHLQMFHKTWMKFDPEASQVIHYSDLSEFCDSLEVPLRLPKPNSIQLIHMDLPLLPGDRIRCLDVLQALTAEVFGDSGLSDDLSSKLEEKFMVQNLSEASEEPISSTLQRKRQEVAAEVIQRAFRKHHQEGHQGGASPMAVESI